MTSQFSSQEVLGSTPSKEEVTVTLELPSQEEQWNNATPIYSSRDEYKITTTPRKERNSSRPTPYNPPHKIFIPPDTKWDKKIHPNYKPQNVILSKKYAHLLEVCCGFLQGREARNINTPVSEQGFVKKYDNKNNETEEVEDIDMKDQNDIDNHNVNINCKENGVVVEVNKVNVNNNYERIEVIPMMKIKVLKMTLIKIT